MCYISKYTLQKKKKTLKRLSTNFHAIKLTSCNVTGLFLFTVCIKHRTLCFIVSSHIFKPILDLSSTRSTLDGCARPNTRHPLSASLYVLFGENEFYVLLIIVVNTCTINFAINLIHMFLLSLLSFLSFFHFFHSSFVSIFLSSSFSLFSAIFRSFFFFFLTYLLTSFFSLPLPRST